MLEKVHILCAVRDRHAVEAIARELDDGVHCTFQIVTDGRAALHSGRQFPPDILVADAILPGMDGLGLADSLRGAAGGRAMRIIGGAAMPFAAEGFRRRGAYRVLDVPWRRDQLHRALTDALGEIDHGIDWEAAHAAYEKACALLTEMGMHAQLKGFAFLAWSAALAYENEVRLFAVRERLYRPIAARFQTTPENVERLIRHAVESTMNTARARGVYGLFGNTIDPARGKPTNAQMLGLLVQRLRVS